MRTADSTPDDAKNGTTASPRAADHDANTKAPAERHSAPAGQHGHGDTRAKMPPTGARPDRSQPEKSASRPQDPEAENGTPSKRDETAKPHGHEAGETARRQLERDASTLKGRREASAAEKESSSCCAISDTSISKIPILYHVNGQM